MINSPIQGLFIQPRQGSDPRIAKIDETSLGVGSDGILYKMLDHRDWQKFRTLTDEEIQDELGASRSIKENMYMLNGKSKNGKLKTGSHSRGIKVTAPQFGTQSRTRKIEKRSWENDMSTLVQGGSPECHNQSGQYIDTMKTLVKNQHINDGTLNDFVDEDRRSEPRFVPAGGGLPVRMTAEDRVQAAISTMKDKYEQNLYVVERLFDEKKIMERKIQLLEERLQKRVGGDKYYEDPTTHEPPSYDDVVEEYAEDHMHAIRHSEYDPDECINARDRSQKRYVRSRDDNETTYSATDAARAFDRRAGANTSGKISRPSSAPPRRPVREQERDEPYRGSTERRSRASRESTGRSSRSSSVRRSGGVTVPSVSANLQADADRYIQKRRMLEEQERLKKLEDERYEQQLRERNLRASMNGKEFTEMRKRQEIAERQSKERLDKFQQKQAEAEEALRKERKAKADANRASMTLVTKNQLSWRELQEIEESKRRERIERRKQELAQVSALPGSIAQNLQKSRREPTVDQSNTAVKNEFKAEDPAKVAAKLARAQKVWEMKMEREKERNKDKTLRLSSTAGSGSGTLPTKTAMELRNEQYAAKREAKALEKKEREEAEARKRKAEEEAHKAKILNQKVPIGKPTNAAIMKAEKVRNDRLREQEEERRVRARMRKKEISEKEASAALRVIISEREIERHGGSGTHYELHKNAGIAQAERKAAEAAAAAREEYRQQLRANKKKIADSLATRKSLMERHDSALAAKAAGQDALFKVAGAVGVDSSGKEDHHGDYDFFDAKEQVRLGLKKL